MNKIELNKIVKKYRKNDKEITILKNISYKFNAGNVYIIMGDSGAGKTTLINTIVGLVNLDSGTIKIDNEELNSKEDYSKIRNEKIGMVFQSYLLNENMNAIENVMLPLLLKNNLKTSKVRATELLKKIGLEDRYNHYPKELSGGEQQRVAIARALANDPDIIIADEPTGNLDKKNEKSIFEQFVKLAKEDNKCIIVVSHNEQIKEYADKVLILKDGELYEDK